MKEMVNSLSPEKARLYLKRQNFLLKIALLLAIVSGTILAAFWMTIGLIEAGDASRNPGWYFVAGIMLNGFIVTCVSHGFIYGSNLPERLRDKKREASSPRSQNPQAILCSTCGTLNKPHSKTCKKCGALIET
ncbi:MAG: hypothetical protein ACXAEL_12135 [Candidatus Hodarchaeales archaeon]